MTRPTVPTTLLSIAALGALLLSACSPSATAEAPATDTPTSAGAAPAEVRVSGPASPPSLPILRMIEADALGDTDIVFDRWESADQLTAAATGGHEFVAAPLTTGAALASGGADIQLLNVSAWAVMGLVTNDAEVQSIADLAGTQIHVAMRASAVDYTMQLVLEQHGLTDSVEIVYVDPMNGPEQFLSGQISSLVTVEPQVSMLEARSPEARSLVDFSAEWADLTGSKLPLPTAGTFVNTAFAAEHPETAVAFQEAYAEAATWVSEHPEEAGALAERELGLPGSVVATAIPKISWDAQAAAEARPAVDLYFSQLFERWPESVGGALPETDFPLPGAVPLVGGGGPGLRGSPHRSPGRWRVSRCSASRGSSRPGRSPRSSSRASAPRSPRWPACSATPPPSPRSASRSRRSSAGSSSPRRLAGPSGSSRA